MNISHKKLLIISETYPTGLSGTSVKTRNTIKFLLSKNVVIDMLCLKDDKIVKREITHQNLRIFSFDWKKYNQSFLKKIFKFFQLFFSLIPIQIKKTYNKNLDEKLAKIQLDKEYDYVLFDGFCTLQYLPTLINLKAKKIYIDDEDFTDLMKNRFEKEKDLFYKLFYFFEYLKCLYIEKKYFSTIDQIWAISQKTLARFKTISKTDVFLMPTIVETNDNVFSPKSSNIIFVGLLNWDENIKGLRWFLEKCWSRVLNQFPQTELVIVGQGASDSFKQYLLSNKNVVHCNYIEKLDSVFKKSALAISPVLINSGIKLKVLTYLSYGMPVVATEESTWGLISTNGVLFSSNPEKFSDLIIELLKSKSKSKKLKLSELAIKNIEKNHSTNVLQSFFEKVGILDL